MKASDDCTKKGPELFFGLVGALGSDLTAVATYLGDALADMSYRYHLVRVSKLLHDFDKWKALPVDPLDEQIRAHQEAGNELRALVDGGAMAALAIGSIQGIRQAEGENPNEPLPGRAYVIRSLKHSEEVDLLRRVYGSAFFLVAAYSPVAEREKRLAHQIAQSRQSGQPDEYLSLARELIRIDEAEEEKLGQRVRDVFPLADVFLASHRTPDLKRQVERFIELVFGNPFRTPTRSEFAMFQARSAALRSADLSRQVGAVIATSRGDVVAVGTNEVPRAAGGLYWEGDDGDARDFQLGRNTSQEYRQLALGEVLKRLEEMKLLKLETGETVENVLGSVLEKMDNTLLMNSGEFGRTVHAEMAALLDAANRGVRVDGCTLYSTTFPCHNCAKHIVAAGITRVEYVEPFPKSLASRLHEDALSVDAEAERQGRVAFQPFVGVAPRRYADLFQLTARRDESGDVRRWRWADALPRYPETWPAVTYPMAEDRILLDLRERMVRAELVEETA